jgi:uncharacterized protein (DUF302 family)
VMGGDLIGAFETVLAAPLDEAEASVRESLSAEGFGVLSEIDVAATLAAKIGVKRPGLKILGACNPQLANRALNLEPSTALFLPCNVVLEELSNGHTRVAIVDPRQLLAKGREAGTPELEALGQEAADALEQVCRSLTA